MRTVLAVLLASSMPCMAANIEVKGDRLLFVGTIEADDYEKFAALIQPIDRQMTVVLHSRGGLTVPSLRIGRLIRQRGWNTSCPIICQSSASLIWMGGVKRYRTLPAEIGFHSAFTDYKTFNPS